MINKDTQEMPQSRSTAFPRHQKRRMQSTHVISKSMGLPEILRDIPTSTYQICKIKKKKKQNKKQKQKNNKSNDNISQIYM